MSTMKDVEKSFECWLIYIRGINVMERTSFRAIELMEKVVEEMKKQAKIILKSGEKVSDDTVLGTDTRVAFDEFLKFVRQDIALVKKRKEQLCQ
jgi:GTP cyclohydrolase III